MGVQENSQSPPKPQINKYFFKIGIILTRIIIRSTIIYGLETYYNLKENEFRVLEQIEEVFIRKLLKTSSGCPISQIDLKTGHVPARFEIYKWRCLFLKHILTENSKSMIYKIVMYKNPSKRRLALKLFQ